MYLHEHTGWWKFRYDTASVINKLAEVRLLQGKVLGNLSSIGFSQQNEAQLTNLSLEIVKSSEIEGEMLNLEQVRSSIAQRLGIPVAGTTKSSRYIDGVVEMMIDATQNYTAPLSDERLFGWHNVLFPTGMSGLYRIDVAKYRIHEMQVVSGAMGHEKVHYQAPAHSRVKMEMNRLIKWINSDNKTDAVLSAAIVHLWFVTIHPFDDGNGRIARALTEMMLSRADGTPMRFYSMSNQIQTDKKNYYNVLERAQRGDGNITEWILWFLDCMKKSLLATEDTLSSVLKKAHFWDVHSETNFNARQKKLINMLFDGFFGKLTTGKWAKIAKCSSDTALNDINDLVDKGVLVKNQEGGRSTNYSLTDNTSVQ